MIQFAGCWARLRRKLYDLHISDISQAATQTIIAMAELWLIEDDIQASVRYDNRSGVAPVAHARCRAFLFLLPAANMLDS